jgi:hypothetical protein
MLPQSRSRRPDSRGRIGILDRSIDQLDGTASRMIHFLHHSYYQNCLFTVSTFILAAKKPLKEKDGQTMFMIQSIHQIIDFGVR